MTDTSPISEEDLLRFHSGGMEEGEKAALAARLATDAAARALLAEWDRQDAALRDAFDAPLAEPVPAPLRRMLGAAREEDRAPLRGLTLPRRLAASMLLAVGATGGYLLGRADAPRPEPAKFVQDALSAYATYAVEVAHPVEVEAARADHLTKWLSKRLGQPIRAPDFAAAGFRLMGGRLLPSDAGPAALFMYEDDLGRRVTLYVTPGAEGGETAFRFIEQGETQSFYWIDGTLSCAVTGNIPRDLLRQIAVAAYDQLA